MALYPLAAKRRVISLVPESQPGRWWITRTPGKGPVTGGEGLIGVDLGALVAGERDVPGAEGLFGCGHSGLLLRCRSVARGCSLRRPYGLARPAGRRAPARMCGRPRAPVLGRPATGMMCARAPIVRGPGRARPRSPPWGSAAGAKLRQRPAATAPAVRTIVGPGVVDSPGGIALDAAGNIVVADTGHCRVLVVPSRSGTLDGLHLRAGHAATLVGGTCTGAQSHRAPVGVAVDGHGDIFVAEATAQRVQEVRAGDAHRRDGGRHGRRRLQRRRARRHRQRARPAHRCGGGRGRRPLHRRHGQLPGARAARP